MTDDNNSSIEMFSTPKLSNSGDGDGIKNVTTRKRTPVPSSRKFNVRTQCDESVKLKLEKALIDLQKTKKHNCLTKAQSIAEITPSKTKSKKKPYIKLELAGVADIRDTFPLNVTLHATPRPFEVPSTASAQASRRCTRDWAVCTVYGRLLLCVWRRYKARLQTLSESSGRQLNQINQLELQVDFLKSMRQSECDKRNEALHEYQLMKKKIEVMELANNTLIQDMKTIQEELVNTKKNLKLTKYDLKKCCEQLTKNQELLMKRKEEKMDLVAQIASQEQEILTQNATILNLQEKQSITEMNLHNVESSYKVKQKELIEVKEQVEIEVKQNILLKDTISSLQKTKLELQERAEHLEDELEMYISNIEEMKDENVSIREDLKEANQKLSTEKNKRWIKITKELSLLSLSALQKIAEVVLQVYHKY